MNDLLRGLKLYAVIRMDPVMGCVVEQSYTVQMNAEVHRENLARAGKTVLVVPMVPELAASAGSASAKPS